MHILVLDEAASQAYWDAEAAAFGQSSSRELCMLLFVRELMSKGKGIDAGAAVGWIFIIRSVAGALQL